MNYLGYPTNIMRITQSYSSYKTHNSYYTGMPCDYPIDDVCLDSYGGFFSCPCDEMVVKKVYEFGTKSKNAIWLQSTTKVYMPVGYDIVTLMVVLPSCYDLSTIYVGRRYKRGQKIFSKKSYTTFTNKHFHLSVGRGEFIGNGWVKNNNNCWVITTKSGAIKPEQAFYIDPKRTEIIDCKSLKFCNSPKS